MAGNHLREPLDYLYEELPPERMAEVRRHLAECPECRAQLRTIRETVKLYRQAEHPIAPAGLSAKTIKNALRIAREQAAAKKPDAPSTAERDSSRAKPVPAKTAPEKTAPAKAIQQPARQSAQQSTRQPPAPTTPPPAEASREAAVSYSRAALVSETAGASAQAAQMRRSERGDAEFARLKEEVLGEIHRGGWRSWLFHPAWTVAASVIFLCALLVHFSPRMHRLEPSTALVAAPRAVSTPAASDVTERLRERERLPASLPPVEGVADAATPVLETPPILQEAAAMNEPLELIPGELSNAEPAAGATERSERPERIERAEQTARPWRATQSFFAAEEQDSAPAAPEPESSGTRRMRSPERLLINTPATAYAVPDAHVMPSIDETADKTNVVTKSGGENAAAFGKAASQPPEPPEQSEPAKSFESSERERISAKSKAGVFAVPVFPSPRPARDSADEADGIETPVTKTPVPASAPESVQREQRRESVPAPSRLPVAVMARESASDPAAAIVVLDGFSPDDAPMIVERPAPMDVRERVRSLTTLIGMQIASREFADARMALDILERYDAEAAAELRRLLVSVPADPEQEKPKAVIGTPLPPEAPMPVDKPVPPLSLVEEPLEPVAAMPESRAETPTDSSPLGLIEPPEDPPMSTVFVPREIESPPPAAPEAPEAAPEIEIRSSVGRPAPAGSWEPVSDASPGQWSPNGAMNEAVSGAMDPAARSEFVETMAAATEPSPLFSDGRSGAVHRVRLPPVMEPATSPGGVVRVRTGPNQSSWVVSGATQPEAAIPVVQPTAVIPAAQPEAVVPVVVVPEPPQAVVILPEPPLDPLPSAPVEAVVQPASPPLPVSVPAYSVPVVAPVVPVPRAVVVYPSVPPVHYRQSVPLARPAASPRRASRSSSGPEPYMRDY